MFHQCAAMRTSPPGMPSCPAGPPRLPAARHPPPTPPNRCLLQLARSSYATGGLGQCCCLQQPMRRTPLAVVAAAAAGVEDPAYRPQCNSSSGSSSSRGSNSGSSSIRGSSRGNSSGSSSSSGVTVNDIGCSTSRPYSNKGGREWGREPRHSGRYRTSSSGEAGSPRPPPYGARGQGGPAAAAPGAGGGSPAYASDMDSLARMVEAGVHEWAENKDYKSLCAAFTKAGKLAERPGMGQRGGVGASSYPQQAALLRRTFGALAEVYLPLLPGVRNPIALITPLHACAKAGYWGDGARDGLAAALVRRLAQDGGAAMQQANGQGHSNTWWAVSVAPPEVLPADSTGELLRASEARMLQMMATEFAPQASANVLLACARLSDFHSSSEVLHHLTACLLDQMADGNEQALANAWWALSKLREEGGHTPHPTHLQRLAAAVTARLAAREHAFIPQALSNILWGCAKLGYTDPALLRSLAAAAAQAAGGMKAQGLSNILLAVVELQVDGVDGLSAALAEECRRRHFTSFEPQAISNAAWALAKLGYGKGGEAKEQAWFQEMVEAVMRPGAMAGATPQAWSNLLYALALVLHQPPPALLEGAVATVSEASTQACGNMLWALAVLRLHDDQRLVDALAGRLGEVLQQDHEQLNGQNLANSLWALAVMGPEVLERHANLVAQLLREVVGRWKAADGDGSRSGGFPEEGLVQLWQLQLELDSLGGAGGASILATQPHLLDAMRVAVMESAAQQAHAATSDLQKQVVAGLYRLQQQQPCAGDPLILSVEVEYWREGLCGPVDAVVMLPGGRIVAVEVDGPWHFLTNRQEEVDGSTELRNRQLRRVFGEGDVVSVPYQEWCELKGTAAQDQYLSLLVAMGAGPGRLAIFQS